MSLFEAGRPVTHIPTFAREVYDVTGAGDTVMAVLALALAAGAPMREAAVLANYGAGVVVGKRGTATVSRGELARALRDGGQAVDEKRETDNRQPDAGLRAVFFADCYSAWMRKP